MKRDVVCISRAVGALGEEVGRLVAERLGYRYVDEEIVLRAAQIGNVDPETARDAERRKSLLRRLLEEVRVSGADSYVYVPLGAPMVVVTDDEGGAEVDLRSVIREAVRETAADGSAVIVAHAASHALADSERALRVLVTASVPVRVARLAEEAGLDAAAAEKALKDSDRDRGDYLKRFYGVDAERPTDYDLVLSTDRLSAEEAASLVVSAAG